MEQEQENVEIQERQTGFKDKAIGFLKGLFADKVRCLYAVTLLLQIVFIALQFVPVIFCTTQAKEYRVAGVLLSVEVVNEKLSVCDLLTQDSITKALFWGAFALLVISVKNTVRYFVKKGTERYAGFFLPKFAVIVALGLYAIVCAIGEEWGEKYLEYGSVFETLTGGTWYLLIAIVLLVCLFVLSAWVKAEKEKEKIEAKVQEELQKERSEQNAQNGI